jgi:hypothetical protein
MACRDYLLLDTARLESTEKVVGRSGTILPNMEGNWLLHRVRHGTVQTAAPALQKYDLILSYSVGQVGAVVAPAQLAGVVDADRQTRHWGKGKVDCNNLHKGLLLVQAAHIRILALRAYTCKIYYRRPPLFTKDSPSPQHMLGRSRIKATASGKK